MAYDPNSNEYEHTSWTRFRLTKENKDKSDRASLQWQIDYDNPRMVVYTSNNNTKKPDGSLDYNKRITAAFKFDDLPIVFATFDSVIKGPNDTEETIECKNVQWVNGVKTDTIYVQCTVHIGKDSDGVVYIYLEEGDKPKIKFEFLPNDRSPWVSYKPKGSTEVSKGYLSTFYASKWLSIVEFLLMRQADRIFTTTKMLYKKTPSTRTYTKPVVETPKHVEPIIEHKEDVYVEETVETPKDVSSVNLSVIEDDPLSDLI